MKKQSIVLTTILIAAFFTSQAQVIPAVRTEKTTNEEENLVKNAIDLTIRAKFHDDYPNASEESWTRMANGYYVSYTANDIVHTVYLNKKGVTTGKILTYHEKDMPATLRRQINDLGGCSTIQLVKEVTTDLGTAYLVTISDAKSWKVMRVNGNDMEVMEEHAK